MEFLTVTNIIVGVTCLISYLAFSDPKLKMALIFHPYKIKRERALSGFFTSGLIHADFMHLAFNMFTLYSFGNVIEQYFKILFPGYGVYVYIALYILGLLFSHMPVYAKQQDNPGYFALGASGAVSAVLFASVLLDPWSYLYIMAVLPCPQIVAAIGFVWYSSYMDKHGNDNIGHSAHLFGAVFGFLFTGAMQPALFVNFFECAISFNTNCIYDYIMQLRGQ